MSGERGVIWIGEWRLDPAVRSLRRGTQEHRLEPKMLDVLLLLAEHEGRPVPRVDLERGVWSGAAVGTELLNRTVWKLRKALGDDPGDPTYIETIPRVGYRLVAPVRRDEAEAVASTSSNRSAARWVWTIGAVVAAAAMVVLALRRGSGGTGSVGPSAVHIVPLTATPGYEAAPALSPDGGRVAFQRYDPDSPSPTWDIAVVEIESSAVQPVPSIPTPTNTLRHGHRTAIPWPSCARTPPPARSWSNRAVGWRRGRRSVRPGRGTRSPGTWTAPSSWRRPRAGRRWAWCGCRAAEGLFSL